MTLLAVKAFNGIRPISDPRLLGQNEAQTAQNVRLISGSLVPLRGVSNLKSTVLASPATIFRYGNSVNETDYWLEFSQDTDIMRSPVAGDQFDRLYWTDGNNQPRYATNSLILQAGTGAYPRASYLLGIPKPSTAPTISSFTAPTTYTKVTREYVLTLYNPTSAKESSPSTVFSVQGVDGEKVSVTGLTTDNRGDAGVTKKRLYRKVSGTFRRLVELDLSVTTYDDTATDASLSAAPTISSSSASVPTPTRAPVATAAAITNTGATSTYEYVYTVKNIQVNVGTIVDPVYEYYRESAPSGVRSVTANAAQNVTIGNFNNALGGSFYRIYRKDSGSTQYKFVGEIPVGQSTFVDDLDVTTLGTPLNFDAPSTQFPSTTPSGTVSGTAASGTTVQRIYMVTFVDSSGNESSKGPISNVVNVIDGVTSVSLTHSETAPAGVAKKKIYRQTVTSTNGVINLNDANWKFVGEVTASATTGTDVATEASLTTGLPASIQAAPPAPTGAPTLTAVIPPNEIPESRTYVITYVSAYGEEGPPSDASNVAEVDPTEAVTVSIPGSPVGNYNITLKRIYRSSTVGSRATFQFVAEVPVAQSSYSDSVTQANLGENLPSDGWIAPPAGLKGMRLMANGAAVGFVGRTVYFSEPNLPHAWPHQYTVDDDIVAIGTFGQTVAVLTKSYPYLFQGVDPAAMSSSRMLLPQACSSKRSLIEIGDGVMYASPDGMVSIGSGGASVITQNIYSRDQWQALNPSSMQSYVYNGRVIVFYSGGVLLLDVSGQGALLTTSNINSVTGVTAGYYEPKSDILYLAQGANIVRFDSGGALMSNWKSKVFRLGYHENLSVAQVRADAYPVTFKIYGDGVLRHTKTVESQDQFRLPSGFRCLNWEIQLEGANTITEVAVATSSVELKAV